MDLSRFLRFNGRLGIVNAFLNRRHQPNNTLVMPVTGGWVFRNLYVSTADRYLGFVISTIFARLFKFYHGLGLTTEYPVFSTQIMEALLRVLFLSAFLITIKAMAKHTLYSKCWSFYDDLLKDSGYTEISLVNKKFMV